MSEKTLRELLEDEVANLRLDEECLREATGYSREGLRQGSAVGSSCRASERMKWVFKAEAEMRRRHQQEALILAADLLANHIDEAAKLLEARKEKANETL